MCFNLTVPTVYAAVDAQTQSIPSAPTGARSLGATLTTAVRRLRTFGAAVAWSPRHGASFPGALGATDVELARLSYSPTERELERTRWNTILREEFGGRWS